MSYLKRSKGTVTKRVIDSPTFVTPALGTPASGVMTNLTGTLTSPTFVTPALGTPASGVVTNLTGTLATAIQDNIVRLGTVTTGTFEGTIDGSTTFTGDAQQKTCSSWVNFNHTSTLAIRDSYNVSSVTDNGTGDATVNIDTDMGNGNYSLVGSCNHGAGTNSHLFIGGCTGADCDPVAGSYRLNTLYLTGSTQNTQDTQQVFASVFGDTS